MTKRILHLVANAHLDPVWLWDWRDGMTEGIVTCRTMLDLMDEDSEFTFVRGEASIYRHIEKHDPATFARIEERVAEGRWDVVGGTWVQPDTNLPATETFARHFLHGQRYFESRFGRRARVAWAADSFGHAAGLPDIMADSGITGFAFTRPDAGTLPLDLPAFWWEGCGGNRVLAYRPMAGWYGSERSEVAPKLDKILALAEQQTLANVGFFYGLGDHGGGASRRHLAEIRAWSEKHPEVEVVHSGLHRLFDAIAAESEAGVELPLHRGEMNFCCRGCYASVARFKWEYRRVERRLADAETLNALSAAALDGPAADLEEQWLGVLFSTFHDILPGSAIERSYDDQLAWLGSITHRCLELESDALTALAARIDTRPPAVEGDHPTAVPILVWNPHPHAFRGHVEIEASVDYRLIQSYQDRAGELPVEVRSCDGTVLPQQIIETEHHFAPNLPWRKRAVVPVELPPLGWQVLTMGWVEGAKTPTSPGTSASSPEADTIANGRWRVQASSDAAGVYIERDGRPLFDGDGLSVRLYADAGGSWGGGEGPGRIDLEQALESWTVTRVAVREHGPQRAALAVRLAGDRSRVDLTFLLCRDADSVEVRARWFVADTAARVRLLMPGVESIICEVPGGTAERGAVGEVPALSWVRARGPVDGFGFASDALSSFVVAQGTLAATVARTAHFAHSLNAEYTPDPWWSSMDLGEHLCRFALYPADADLPARARELVSPPHWQVVPAGPATAPALAPSGSFAAIAPDSLRLEALKPAADGEGLVLRVHESSGKQVEATLELFGTRIELGAVKGGGIASWRLRRTDDGWSSERCNVLEQ